MEIATDNARISLRNDYSEGAHPRLLQALAVASAEVNRGYGLDVHSARAAALVRDRLGRDADVHFLAGGTQTNLVALAAFLRPHEAVIAPASGHIATHETGAIEASGHKVLTVATPDGKLSPALIRPCIDGHHGEHMVKPHGMGNRLQRRGTAGAGRLLSRSRPAALRRRRASCLGVDDRSQ